jgi:hypothetical protein
MFLKLKFMLLALATGHRPMASRVHRDAYSVPGVGEVRTRGCTVSAERMDVVIEGGSRPWLYFLDADGEVEGGCEVDVRINVVPMRREPLGPIHRGIATTGS